jgi:hypothetical protein
MLKDHSAQMAAIQVGKVDDLSCYVSHLLVSNTIFFCKRSESGP